MRVPALVPIAKIDPSHCGAGTIPKSVWADQAAPEVQVTVSVAYTVPKMFIDLTHMSSVPRESAAYPNPID